MGRKGSRTGSMKECKECGKHVYVSPCLEGRKMFCSVTCARRYQMKGNKNYFHSHKFEREKSPNWKGGKRTYRRMIFEISDKPACIICGRTNEQIKLVAHHKDGNRDNNNLENLQILCWGCHNRIHGNYEKIKEIKMQKKRIMWCSDSSFLPTGY